MKTFTLGTDNNITAYATRKTATATGLAVFASEEQMAEVIGRAGIKPIDIWNSLPGVEPVKKFASSKIAFARLWKQLQSLEPTPEPVEAEATAEAAAKPKRQRKERAATDAPATIREGTKKALVVSMLEREGGATRSELMEATGWNNRFVDGFIGWTVKKVLGRNVVATKREGGDRHYAIQPSAESSAPVSA